jgi:hypothetical protein
MLVLLLLLLLLLLLFGPFFAAQQSFNISSVHIVALQPVAPHVLRLAKEARLWLISTGRRGGEAVTVHRATPAAEAVAAAGVGLPIYTRMALRQGRHSHSEVGSTAALGCLLSHVAIWRSIREGETVAVFEEDARLDEASGVRTVALASDLRGRPWELVVLETGHITSSGEWRRAGAHLATCAPPPVICEWQGSRGYLLRHSGAQVLLAAAATPHVQVDALFWMLAALEPARFRMYWTTESVAHPASAWRGSSVWDRCIKCYVPLSPTLIMVWVALACVGGAVAPVLCVFKYLNANANGRRGRQTCVDAAVAAKRRQLLV